MQLSAAAEPGFDRRKLRGPFDIIGDVHGCADELEDLLRLLGYDVTGSGEDVRITPPPGRMAVFVGDLVDRGPRSPDVLRIAMAMLQTGSGLCVEGNHDNKFARWLGGARVTTNSGLQETIVQMAGASPLFLERVRAFLAGLPPWLWLDEGRLVVAHAGLREEMIGQAGPKVRAFALYGDVTGKTDGFGRPVRADWAQNYRGAPAIVYGHVAAASVQSVNNTWCIDTGCCFGGALSALRWPEREVVSVPARRMWSEPARPLSKRVG